MSKGTENAADTLLADCALCPRRCHVNRMADGRGRCGQGAEIVAARASLHFWEEPCISGERGSGTVFFCGCGLGCRYCQNYRISSGLPSGARTLSPDGMAGVFLSLQEQGACNINLVTPAHFAPRIAQAIMVAKQRGLTLPVVCNTGGYETVETLRLLDGLIDIYLADCKYYSSVLAARCSRAPDYFPVCEKALEEMVRQTGAPVFVTARGEEMDARAYNAAVCDAASDYAGPLMRRGTIVRHLLLPGEGADSRRIVDFLLRKFGDAIYISLMNQYTPTPRVRGDASLDARLKAEEYEALVDYALEQGMENGFIQGEGTDEESFIPSFDGQGL